MSLAAFTHRFVPDATPGRPLVVVMHGRGDSMDGFAWFPQVMDLPATYLFLNAPDEYFGGYSWYDLPPDQGPGILRSRAMLFALLDDLAAAGWAADQVLLFGFSQGCLMALDVGARYPARLRGVCGVSGYVYFADELAAETTAHAREIPWWVSDGSFDEVVPAALTAQGVAALKAAGIPVAHHTFRKAHTLDERQELPALRAWLGRVLAGGGDQQPPAAAR